MMTDEESKNTIVMISRDLTRTVQMIGLSPEVAALALYCSVLACETECKPDPNTATEAQVERWGQYLLAKQWFTEQGAIYDAIVEAGVDPNMPSSKTGNS